MHWSKVEITTERLVLKPYSAQDADDIFSCITPTLTRFMSWDMPASRQEFDLVCQSWLAAIQGGTELTFAIRMRSTARFLGVEGLHRMQTTTPELGIWIREDCHGCGYGREAVAAVTAWASSRFSPAHFLYPVAEENGASRRIAESLGGVESRRQVKRKYTAVIYHIPPM